MHQLVTVQLVVLDRNRTFRRDAGQCAFRRNACHVRRGRHACSSIARGASTLLLWVCGRHACCSIARGASTRLLCVRV